MKWSLPRPQVLDSIFLLAITLLSALPYLGRLRFYSDDWSYMAPLYRSSSSGMGAMFQSLLHTDSGLLLRPVQAISLVLGFKAFGLHPMPYHVLIAVMLATVTILLCMVLRTLQLSRRVSLAISLAFAFLPQDSTDHFWISSQQAVLCMAFALFGVYALLSSTDTSARHPKLWWACASISFVLSVLSYEVALGLIVVSVALIAWRSFKHGPPENRGGKSAAILGVIAPLLLFGLAKTLLQQRFVIHHWMPHFWMHPDAWHRAAVVAIRFNLWTYALHLPSVLTALYRHSALSLQAVLVSFAVASLVAVYLSGLSDSAPLPQPLACLQLAATGVVLFFLGYGLFFLSPSYNFESSGLNNRVTIASALGASCLMVALAGLASNVAGSSPRQARLFSVAVGVMCGAWCLALNGIAYFWIDAASKQAAALQTVRENLKHLPHHSYVLLDGICRYAGPAVVFETDWDTTGALQLTLGDPTLTGDIVSSHMRFDQNGVDSFIYGDPEGHYPYGERLFIFNVSTHLLTNLASHSSAMDYLRTFNPLRNIGCNRGTAGDGVPIF